MKKQNPEHELQVECIKWYKSKYPRGIVFSVPNQGKRNAAQMNYFIAEGFLVGAPDLVLMNTEGKIVFAELKTKTGRLSERQVELKEKCDNLDEELYNVVRSLEDFIKVVEKN